MNSNYNREVLSAFWPSGEIVWTLGEMKLLKTNKPTNPTAKPWFDSDSSPKEERGDFLQSCLPREIVALIQGSCPISQSLLQKESYSHSPGVYRRGWRHGNGLRSHSAVTDPTGSLEFGSAAFLRPDLHTGAGHSDGACSDGNTGSGEVLQVLL